MRNLLTSPIAAITQAELLFNLKRAAPRILIVLFGLNAILWWGAASVHYGWASNSDFYIARLFGGFSFLTAPFFAALMMGDAVARDLRFEIHPLLFSSPISRAEYLLGKFFGNFLALVGCFAGFAVTLFLLQWARKQGMIVLPWRVAPYLKHFLTFVVVTHLAIAAICFAAGAMTRSPKLVYGLVVICYVLYIAVFGTLAQFSPHLVSALDPFLFDWVNRIGNSHRPEVVNQLAIAYDVPVLANRAVMLGLAAVCLTILCRRFSIEKRRSQSSSTILSLNEPAESIGGLDESNFTSSLPADIFLTKPSVPIPGVTVATKGLRARLKQFAAAVGAEFRLLKVERSLIVIAPLAILACALELSPAGTSPVASVYAVNSAQTLLVVLFGVTLFYTGEMMHRDREVRIEPLLWSAPVPDRVVLLSKFAAIFLMALALMIATVVTAVLLHLYRTPASVELWPYFPVYSIILLPSVIFMIGATITLHAVLREKYVAHVAGLGLGGGLIYLMMQGNLNPLYNPTLYRLWSYADLEGLNPFHNGIILHRAYWLAVTATALAVAHLFFQRPAGRRRGAAALAIAAFAAAIILGLAVRQ